MKICKNKLHTYPKENKYCKECKSIYNKKWAIENKDRKDSNYKKHYSQNKDKILSHNKEYHQKNKVKIKKQQKVYNEKNKDKIKVQNRKTFIYKKYNLTEKEFNDLYSSQNGLCAICQRSELDINKTLNIDHCHKTNKVRGLLCGDCNRALGMFRDQYDLCYSAGNYLKSHEQSSQEDHTSHYLVPPDDLAPNEF